MPAENVHATLAFLGSRPAEDRDRLARILAPVTGAFANFEAEISGTGVFPSRRRPRILWLGIDAPQELYDLHSSIVDALEEHFEIPPERRPYRPHFTLARARSHFPLRLVERCELHFGGLVGETFEVHEVTLWRSHLSSSGARYEALERFALGC